MTIMTSDGTEGRVELDPLHRQMITFKKSKKFGNFC